MEYHNRKLHVWRHDAAMFVWKVKRSNKKILYYEKKYHREIYKTLNKN